MAAHGAAPIRSNQMGNIYPSPTGLYPFGQFSEGAGRSFIESQLSARNGNYGCPDIGAESVYLAFAVIGSSSGDKTWTIDPLHNQGAFTSPPAVGDQQFAAQTNQMHFGLWQVDFTIVAQNLITGMFVDGAYVEKPAGTFSTLDAGICILPPGGTITSYNYMDGVLRRGDDGTAPALSFQFTFLTSCYWAITSNWASNVAWPAILGGTIRSGDLFLYQVTCRRLDI